MKKSRLVDEQTFNALRDAFVRSCGFQDGDVVPRINDVVADTPDPMPGIACRIDRNRRGVVVVLCGDTMVDVVIEDG
jgi:hypothetical protein